MTLTNEERLRRSWEANASAWRDAVRQQRIESRRLVTDAAIVQAVLDQRPGTVLDAGCGEGWLARALAAHGVSVTGIDGSGPLIEAARELGGGRFLLATYGDEAFQVLLREQRFDVAVANFSLLGEQLTGPLRSLSTALTANGSVIVQTVHPRLAGEPYADGWRVETFDSIDGCWQEQMPWYFRTVESWMAAFAHAGLAVVETREPVHPGRRVPASMIFVAR